MAYVWVEAIRPRTLPASVAPVVVGTGAASQVIAWRASCALLTALALQITANLANDLSDAERGVDTPDRVGPRRVTASGLVSRGAMKKAIAVSVSVAGLAGAALAWAVGPELLVVGGGCIGAALAYSGGRRPYGAHALGEVAVFAFFGLVATTGSAYVQVERVVPEAVAASVPMGLLAAAILAVNNLRDIATDERAGKRTLAVRLGRERAAILYKLLVAGAYVALIPVAIVGESLRPLAPWVSLPAAWVVTRPVAATADPRDLVAALGHTARLQLGFAALLALGLWTS